jgi:uncharacterized membrane protein YedE/YeeE
VSATTSTSADRAFIGGALLTGLLFGTGLVLSGMTLPDKVIGFLNPFSGAWDPSLGLVMVGAIGVHAVLMRVILKRGSPLIDSKFHLPTRKDLDPKLIGGAALFGIGWGLGGVCPGPGLVGAASLASPLLLFVGGLALGMGIFRLTNKA